MQKVYINDILLDEEQSLPILENKKHSLIVAGAGSGKTCVLVGKIKYMLEHHWIKKEEICCISLTNEAVNHLRDKLKEETHEDIYTVTFHRLALDLLKKYEQEYHVASDDLLAYSIQELLQTEFHDNEQMKKTFFQYHHVYLFQNHAHYQKILQDKKMDQEIALYQTFIHLFASQGYTKDKWLEILSQVKKKQEKRLLFILYTIYTYYETEKESNQTIDFDDMIKQGILLLKNHNLHLPYKLILIDEFQDTSPVRFALIQEILKQTDASLCVVGDDYQSIYHFSGCDLDLFLNFKQLFPDACIYKLQKTYRHSEELSAISGHFVLKNPYQIQKEFHSNTHEKYPIHIVYYQNVDTILKKIIHKIPKDKKIYLLGRNHFDIQLYTKKLKYELKENKDIFFESLKDYQIRYYTIHASKGLESDVVILLNVSHNLYGIPTLVQDEKILRFVKKSMYYPNEEERRLFYVALTRTKSIIYLLVPFDNPSPFIREIKRNKNVKSEFYP